MNGLWKFTCLVRIDQFMETIARVTQLEKHIRVFDIIADLVFDDSGTVYEPWVMHQCGYR